MNAAPHESGIGRGHPGTIGQGRSLHVGFLSDWSKDRLLQLRVLGFGLLQDRNIRVSIFPEGEEIFVGGEGTDAGGIGIRALRGLCLQSIRTSHTAIRVW